MSKLASVNREKINFQIEAFGLLYAVCMAGSLTNAFLRSGFVGAQEGDLLLKDVIGRFG